MDIHELKSQISLGEDSRRQFKVDVRNPDSLAAEMAAFANSEGGTLYIGVKDDGSIPGLSMEDVGRINQLISNCASQHVRSPLTVQTENVGVDGGGVVIVLNIPKGIDKPYFDRNGVIWLKCGPDKRRVNSKEELRRLFQSVDLFHADELPTKATVDKLDKIRFRDFLRDVYHQDFPGSSEELSQLLKNMNLAGDDGMLNLAGVLLFAEQPELIKPQFVVKAIRYPGNDIHSSAYLDTDDFSGPLEKQFAGALGFIMRNLHKIQGTEGVNSPGISEIPETVFEELLVNALVHRDYMISAPIRIFIFDNRIEIISPGHLPNNLTVDKIRAGNSNIRNPILVSYIAKGLLPYKGIGSGIRRALDEWSDIDFSDDREGVLFTVTIYRRLHQSSGKITVEHDKPNDLGKSSVESSVESSGKSSGKSSEKILELLSVNQNMTIPQLAEELQITPRAVEKQIAALRGRGLLERVGPKKGGYWRIKDGK